MRKKALSREEREIQVINWFAIRIQHDNYDSATIAEIAGGLGMSPSTHLSNIVNGLVEKGSLTKHEINKPGRWTGWGYKLADGTFQRPPAQERKIKISFGRPNARQLELL